MRRAIHMLLIGLLVVWAQFTCSSPSIAADEPADQAARQAELQRKYPFESLRERLAYEPQAEKKPARSKALSQKSGTGGKNVVTAGPAMETRAESLRKLHYAKAEEFFSVPERNGYSRMRPMSAAATVYFKIPLALIPLEESPKKLDTMDPELPMELLKSDVDVLDPNRAPSLRSLDGYLTSSSNSFANSVFFGYVESIDRVSGFVPHAFWQAPWSGPRGHNSEAREEYSSKYDIWRNTQLQLVSLLKYPKPRVYVSDNLPAMSELVNADTRELNAFESGSLEKLQAGENLSAAATTNTIHMLGALRARRECLECHSVNEGTLLGAFSYILERDPPISAKRLKKLNQQSAASSPARPPGAQRAATTRPVRAPAPSATKR